MASGMATVSNINPATEWLLRDGENCLLTPPLPTPTADRLGRLVQDVELRRRIAAAGHEEVTRYRWDDQIERVWEAINLRDGTLAAESVSGGARATQRAARGPWPT
jgi:glycosyltransferase involved in cell wall biosynthesis